MPRTEDEVRDSAKKILGFDDGEENVKQGTGQITTFNQLGFKGNINKPDGWYLPDDKKGVAIILETKSENTCLFIKGIVPVILCEEFINNINDFI